MTPQDSLTHQPPARSSRTRKLRNALLTLVLGAVIALGGGELVIRMFLFHPDLSAGGIGQSLRQAGRYANGDSDDDYWKLISAFQGEPALVDASNPDPITGWTDGSITPGTYEHIDEVSIGERRPVLLYGDSFAQCGTPPDECFTALLERSEFAEKYAMLNYGVGGYGLDQIYLLLKNSKIGRAHV